MQKRLQHLIYQHSTETQEALSLHEGTGVSALVSTAPKGLSAM